MAGVFKVSALKRTTEVVAHRRGGDSSSVRKSPGRTTFDPIVLERGVTHDSAFEDWANLVWDLQKGGVGSLKNMRKDIIVDLYNEANQLVKSYQVYRCWPSEYIALVDLDANATSVAIERLTLQNEGWARDTSVVEPVED
ncbi:MAG: phage tail protein [Chloroflexota bacterium]|nr:phage tail protein [Chloroflexota bacterium]